MNKTTNKYFPNYGWAGLFLIILFWILNWSLDGLRTHWGFFPLWLGYTIFVDAVVYSRKGTSLIARNLKLFIGLFLISIPSWWLFELYNTITNNWLYDGRQFFTNIEYYLLASLSFSTVMPAVFETSELVGTFKWINHLNIKREIEPSLKTVWFLIITGILVLVIIIVFPEIFYPLVWLSAFLIIEPINILMKNNSIFDYTASGEWRTVLALAFGCLICGFFWEMWNYYSYPKWKYNLPMLNTLHVFEMPLPGYIGYLFFPFELFTIYNFITGIFGIKDSKDFIRLLST
ncbi:MAG: hypothetical protein A2000_00715 [Ignavibacteria bacterium GWB2_36_8]|nr:MAG: hypothetical protein A2000_00715 [Ignavibacteria bacterium GWB2_36_8]OGU53085.1 MAG: hypothetical protein A2080_09385 [Ignavibacteria bacterium GWC2_36_12]